MFTDCSILPGVSHITDAMGVSFTLIEGGETALLFDVGYGTENVAEYIRGRTDKPVRPVLSHAHHDHILGARWFQKCFLCGEDLEEFALRTGEKQRKEVADQALSKGLILPEDYLTAVIPTPEELRFPEAFGPFRAVTLELGNRTVLLIHVPGHTPGSLMFYVPEDKLLLTGDNWNPTTWLFFPEAAPVLDYAIHLRSKLRELAFSHILCPHSPVLHSADEFSGYLRGLTRQTLSAAVLSAEGQERGIRTKRCFPAPGQTLVFDADKYVTGAMNHEQL